MPIFHNYQEAGDDARYVVVLSIGRHHKTNNRVAVSTALRLREIWVSWLPSIKKVLFSGEQHFLDSLLDWWSSVLNDVI